MIISKYLTEHYNDGKLTNKIDIYKTKVDIFENPMCQTLKLLISSIKMEL